jgi:CO/xanthine dehydrogenase FAD-binding subunit
VLAEVGQLLSSALEPVADLHGSPEYKLHLTRVLIRRAIERATADGAREVS